MVVSARKKVLPKNQKISWDHMPSSSNSSGKQAGDVQRSRKPKQSQRRKTRVPAAHPNSLHRSILDLQRTAGNQAVIQAIGATSQPHEKQADSIAFEAMQSAQGIEHFFA